MIHQIIASIVIVLLVVNYIVKPKRAMEISLVLMIVAIINLAIQIFY
jgi:hypothetical protein